MLSKSKITGSIHLILVLVIIVTVCVPEGSAQSACWNGSSEAYLSEGTYDSSEGIYPQLAKFCKCAMGVYGHMGYLGVNVSATTGCTYYIDDADNLNWGIDTTFTLAGIWSVECNDSAYYNTSEDYTYTASNPSSNAQVTINRVLPPAGTVSAGETCQVSLDMVVDESNKPYVIGLTEEYPAGWTVSDISHDGTNKGDRIEWLFWVLGQPVQDTTLTYRISIPSSAYGEHAFTGYADVGPDVYNITGDMIITLPETPPTSTTSTSSTTSTLHTTTTSSASTSTASTATATSTSTSPGSTEPGSTPTTTSSVTTSTKKSSSGGGGGGDSSSNVVNTPVVIQTAPATTAPAATTPANSPPATTTPATGTATSAPAEPVATTSPPATEPATTSPPATTSSPPATSPETGKDLSTETEQTESRPETGEKDAEDTSTRKSYSGEISPVSTPTLSAVIIGPSIAVSGSEVVFDASASSGLITSYTWDYDDGTSGSGHKTKHTYAKEGTYFVKLTVTDETGKEDITITPIHIETLNIDIDITAQPLRERYEPGDVITTIEADIRYSNGKTIQGATVTGTLTGKEKKTLTFKETNGKYLAEINHFITTEETELINIKVEAKDPSGRTGSRVKKLILLPKETETMLNMHKPEGALYAYGQKIEFELRFLNDDTGEIMEKGDVILYEGWSEKEYAFVRKGDDFSLTYKAPKNARNPLLFIIYGSSSTGDTDYQAVREIYLDLTHDLAVEVISPEEGAYASEVKEVRLKVTYPDGSSIPDDALDAYTGKDTMTLVRSGDIYTASCDLSGNESDLDICIFDALGNTGQAKINFFVPKEPVDYMSIIQTLLLALAALAVLFLSYKAFERRHKDRESLMKEYEGSRQRIESLKSVTNNVMHEFYTRKISEEEARKRVLDCEKELVIERRKLKESMKKLGMKAPPAEKEEKDAASQKFKKAAESDAGQKTD